MPPYDTITVPSVIYLNNYLNLVGRAEAYRLLANTFGLWGLSATLWALTAWYYDGLGTEGRNFTGVGVFALALLWYTFHYKASEAFTQAHNQIDKLLDMLDTEDYGLD